MQIKLLLPKNEAHIFHNQRQNTQVSLVLLQSPIQWKIFKWSYRFHFCMDVSVKTSYFCDHLKFVHCIQLVGSISFFEWVFGWKRISNRPFEIVSLYTWHRIKLLITQRQQDSPLSFTRKVQIKWISSRLCVRAATSMHWHNASQCLAQFRAYKLRSPSAVCRKTCTLPTQTLVEKTNCAKMRQC